MNKLIICSVLAVLLLTTGIGLAADNKPNEVPSDVQKITFVHYAKSADNSKVLSDETVDMYKLLPGKIKWDHTVMYEIHTDGTQLDPEAVRTAITASLETWDAKTNFELFETPSINNPASSSAIPGQLDYKNIVVWSDLGDGGTIAMNTFWFDRATGKILDSDVQFNTKYPWTISENGVSGTMDLQNIATHEFGHNGLSDLYNSRCMALTMYGYSNFGEIGKRTLGTGDISGIQALYRV